MKRILVVDNNPVILKFMTTLLENLGYQVQTASDGLSALDVVEDSNAFAMFIDLVMPNISGEKLCRIIRANRKFDGVYLVILSAIAAEEVVDYAEFGADACIAKGSFATMSDNIVAVLDQLNRGSPGAATGKVWGIEEVRKRDITSELLLSQRHFRVILENTSEGVLELNPQAKIVLTNRMATSIIGIPEERLLGSDFVAAFGGGHRHRIASLLTEVQNGPQRTSNDSPVILKGRQLAVQLLPITTDEHNSIVVILNDVTDHRKAEEAKRRSEIYQVDKMASVGQMAAGVAHEINNPVAYLLPNLQLLRKRYNLLLKLINLYENGVPGPEIVDFREVNDMNEMLAEIPGMVSECIHGAERIRDITRELGLFSRTGAHIQPSNISELLDSCLTIANNEIRYRARVIRQYSETPLLSVDQGKISQVFLNIIVNATHAIDEGRVEEHWIRVATGRKDDEVFVEIANNGKPIPAEDLIRIFDPFYTTKPRGHGTGLGLSISYSIIQQNGGRIEVDSTSEEGTVFRIWLPIDPIEGPRKKESPPRKPESRDPAKTPDPGRRILVIDDEQPILNAVRRILEPLYKVTTLLSGREAIDMLSSDQDYDLILCDLIMPQQTGMDVYEAVERKQPAMAERFVFMTGAAFTPRAGEFIGRIPNRILEKPFDTAEILQVIADEIAKRSSA